MLLPLRNDVLTRDRLIGSRWRFGKLHEPPMTEQFCFGADGLIKNYRQSNEHSWSFEDGLLRIFNESGALSWVFEIMFLAGERLVLIAQYQNDAVWRPFFCLTELAAEAAPAPAPQPEAVRLVIWDLDDTFWRGTLSEGPVTPVLENLATVRALNARGIMNAVCSKNDVEPVKKVLRNLGIWDEFIFPEIAFIIPRAFSARTVARFSSTGVTGPSDKVPRQNVSSRSQITSRTASGCGAGAGAASAASSVRQKNGRQTASF